MTDSLIQLSEASIQKISRFIQWAETSGLLTRAMLQGQEHPKRAPTYVRNTEAEEIPAFGCMEVHGHEEDSGAGQDYLLVRKPSGDGSIYLLNSAEPIPQDEDGVAQRGDVQRAMRNSGEAVNFGDSWGPTSGQWYLQPGGEFQMLGLSEEVADDVVRVRMPSGSAQYRFAELLADVNSIGPALAREMDKDGNAVAPENLFYVYNWGKSAGVISGAKAGFFALYGLSGSDWIYKEGLECITQCNHGGTLAAPGELNLTEGQAMTDAFVTATGMNSVSLSGTLPTGLTYTPNTSNPETGGTISGTPAAGTAANSPTFVQWLGVADKTGPGTPGVGETCTTTRATLINISAA